MRNRCILLGVDILTASCLCPHKPEYVVPDGILEPVDTKLKI